MVFKIFTVFDSAAEAYTPPFFNAATGQAIRAFTDAVNDPASPLCAYPDDYTLYEIGTFDDNHATIVMYDHSKMLGRGIEYKTQINPTLLDTDHGENTRKLKKSNVSPIQPDSIGSDTAK